MRLHTRLTRLENARASINPADPAAASAELWRRFEKLEAGLVAAGDDLAHKESDSAAVNAVRAMMRGETETARAILMDGAKTISG